MTTCERFIEVAGFDDFYLRERPRLTRLAHLLASAAVAEELAQDALVATHAAWDTLDNPSAYARRVLTNLARSWQRKQVLRRRHEVDRRLPYALPPEVEDMWRHIRRLTPDQRAVVVLRFYEDLTIDEIAFVLDKPAGTVKSHLHRALAALKETLR